MTNRIAAQIKNLVAQLRELDYISSDRAATLIEQQAEQIAELTDERNEAKRELQEAFRHPDFDQLVAQTILRAQSAESEVAALTDENQRLLAAHNRNWDDLAALRKVIEDAPHGDHCALYRLEPNCDCWKSQVPE